MPFVGLSQCREKSGPKKLKVWVNPEQAAVLMGHAIDSACRGGDCLLWEMLNAGADVDVIIKESNGSQISLLAKAARDGSASQMEAILERGVKLIRDGEFSAIALSVDQYVRSEKTQADQQCLSGKVQLLMQKGQKPMTQSARGVMVWFEVLECLEGDTMLPLEVISLFLEAGADLHAAKEGCENMHDKMKRLGYQNPELSLKNVLSKIDVRRHSGLVVRDASGNIMAEHTDVGHLGHTAGSTDKARDLESLFISELDSKGSAHKASLGYAEAQLKAAQIKAERAAVQGQDSRTDPRLMPSATPAMNRSSAKEFDHASASVSIPNESAKTTQTTPGPKKPKQ